MASVLVKGFAEFKLSTVLRRVSPCSRTGFKPWPPGNTEESLDEVWSASVLSSRSELYLFPVALLTLNALNSFVSSSRFFCTCSQSVFIGLSSFWYVCWWLCCHYCRDPARSSSTLLLSYWHPSKTNRRSWERPLGRPVRNTTCFLLAIVCLTISVGFWHPALTSMVNCWKPA